MLSVIFTLDYEIHGNGDGCPLELMVKPTGRMLNLFDAYGAKLTIMADVAEILKFREYRDRFGKDDYHYEAIVGQLRDAVARGHDVQLHLHCSYFNAQFEDGKWKQDWSEYNFAGLSEARISDVLAVGKAFLEEQLRPVKPDYRCNVFRAGNWAVAPSRGVVRGLIHNGFEIDTSVFKYGRRDDRLVRFDYSGAPSELVPWRASETDICQRDEASPLLEAPIYCELRSMPAFFSFNRLYRIYLSKNHRFNVSTAAESHNGVNKPGLVRTLFGKHPWKADFNQCSGGQLIRAFQRATHKYAGSSGVLPFVLIGHSKLFTRQNENTLLSFLGFVAKGRGQFATFASSGLTSSGLEVLPGRPELCLS